VKVGDLVKYTERSCWGYTAELEDWDIMEWQKKIAGLGIIIAAADPLYDISPQTATVVVWWSKTGEAWEPVDRLEIISES
jgi:hypothetical protein